VRSLRSAGDELAVGAELVEHALRVDGVPDDDRVDHDRKAERLLALLVCGALAEMAFVGSSQDKAKRSNSAPEGLSAA